MAASSRLPISATTLTKTPSAVLFEGSRVVTRRFGPSLSKTASVRLRRIRVLPPYVGQETRSASLPTEVFGFTVSRRARCSVRGSAEGSLGRGVTWFTLVERSTSKNIRKTRVRA